MQIFGDSEQGVISVSAGEQSTGAEITLTDAEGNTLINFTPELDYNVVILSSPISCAKTVTEHRNKQTEDMVDSVLDRYQFYVREAWL